MISSYLTLHTDALVLLVYALDAYLSTLYFITPDLFKHLTN